MVMAVKVTKFHESYIFFYCGAEEFKLSTLNEDCSFLTLLTRLQ